MIVHYGSKVNVLPKELSISKDNIWLLLNKTSSILIVDLEKSNKILFSNSNANKLFESEDLVGTKFTYGRISYGEPTLFKYKEILYEMRTSIVTWKDKPSYFILIEGSSFLNIINPI